MTATWSSRKATLRGAACAAATCVEALAPRAVLGAVVVADAGIPSVETVAGWLRDGIAADRIRDAGSGLSLLETVCALRGDRATEDVLDGIAATLLRAGAVHDRPVDHWFGGTALHRAASCGRSAACRLLLAVGADASARSRVGESTWDAAMAAGGGMPDPTRGSRRFAVIRTLIAAGGKPTDGPHGTPLHALAQAPMACHDDDAIARTLVGAGVDPDAVEQHGRRAIHMVHMLDASTTMDRFAVLLDAGCDPVWPDPDASSTPGVAAMVAAADHHRAAWAAWFMRPVDEPPPVDDLVAPWVADIAARHADRPWAMRVFAAVGRTT